MRTSAFRRPEVGHRLLGRHEGGPRQEPPGGIVQPPNQRAGGPPGHAGRPQEALHGGPADGMVGLDLELLGEIGRVQARIAPPGQGEDLLTR